MSRYVAAIVYRKKVGSMARKAILAYCAEKASDDGTGVWTSKQSIAKVVECSKQTVIDTFKDFVKEGLLIEMGRRPNSNGYTIEYDLNIEAIMGLEEAISHREITGLNLDRSNSQGARGQTTGPQEVKPVDPNRPITVLKPSNTPNPKGPDLFQEDEDLGDEIAAAEKSEKEQFEEFWAAYPKKAGKPNARRAFSKAIKTTPAQIIIDGARAYAKWLKPSDPSEFRPHAKHPQGWLTGERWTDEEIRQQEEPEISDYQRRLRSIAQNGGVAR